MGFDMTLMKVNKQSVDEILNKYYQKCLDDLPYEAFEELGKKSGSVLYEARMNLFAGIEDKLPYANEKYVYLTKENYELMLTHCQEKISKYQLDNASEDDWDYDWYKKLLVWFQSFKPDWEEDLIIYEHNC